MLSGSTGHLPSAMAEKAFKNGKGRVPSELLPRPDGRAYHESHPGEYEQRYQDANQADR